MTDLTAPHPTRLAVPASARAWWLIAAAATTISLGMPWKASQLWPIYNVYNPWNCGVDYGGEDWASSQWCFQSLPTYSWYEGGAAPGYQTAIRLFVPLVLVVLLLGLRLGQQRLVVLGAAIATAGVALASTNIGPGQTLYLVGVVALWVGLHRAGMVTLPGRGRWTSRAAGQAAPSGDAA